MKSREGGRLNAVEIVAQEESSKKWEHRTRFCFVSLLLPALTITMVAPPQLEPATTQEVDTASGGARVFFLRS